MEKTNQSLNQSTDAKPKRIRSLDALRGFDMVWILGAEGLFLALFLITGWSVFNVADQQMKHSLWHGFTMYDLIFPLFIFLAGVSLGLAAKNINNYSQQQRSEKYKHAFKRLGLLFLLGIVYNHGWGGGIPADFESIRYVSVLGRIGLAWFVAAMVVWHFSNKNQLLITLAILLGYWLILAFVSVGDFGGGNFGPEFSINAWFDQTFLYGIRYQNLAVDPEGLLSNLGSIVNCLLGVFAGRMLKQLQSTPNKLITKWVIAGAVTVVIAIAFHPIMPINKTLWTPTFVLLTSGLSILFLTLFYWLVDVLNWQRLPQFFIIIGMNSIVIYLATSIVKWQYIVDSLFGGVLASLSTPWQSLLSVICLVAVQWLFLAWLYKHKIFIKI